MKKMLFILCVLGFQCAVFAQIKPFRFAFISDTHIGSPNGSAEEDLRRTVRDINAMKDIAFVVLTGDITELGTNEELRLAKQILDSLNIKWYIIPGNHDTGWSESGGVMFTTVFGYDKFSFEHEGIRFVGCPSGPYVRMSDGHVPRDAMNWLRANLLTLKPKQPVIFLNHYPMDEGMDNWYEVTDLLHNYNTLAILCGHGHANKAMSFDDIPGVMGRSNLRAKAAYGGYNLVDVTADSMVFQERKSEVETRQPWTSVRIFQKQYDQIKEYHRPDFSINDKYDVKAIWSYASDANIISTPAVFNNELVVGNQNGEVVCLSLKKNNDVKWRFKTGAAIFSSPVITEDAAILGSADGFVYSLAMKDGKLNWKYNADKAVLGCPVVSGDTVFIGGSAGSFYAINKKSGKEIWKFKGLKGPVVSTPLLSGGNIVFGAWDRNLYSLKTSTGDSNWTWNNGSSIRNYSPASCIPVEKDGVIYVVAPDRYISAIEAATGKTLWRNNDTRIRESIGISADGKLIYGKTMQDTVVAYAASREKQSAAWKMNAGFGYEHVPSMLMEKDGQVFFGTRSGVVYSIDPVQQKINWAYKIDNSMVNTVKPVEGNRLVASTMDGKIVVLKYK